ncbi:MAG: Transcriptional regulatory protein ompR [uncultured Paraburkholderia sp.]|nr:MAG: Transcriptional regulatory protein ompR [uncultured Paraburkholderia sp.]CAH2942681.1 MAG: Transcriptional regulatory protein ompR [uncultured Paraburkholderia sp.]
MARIECAFPRARCDIALDFARVSRLPNILTFRFEVRVQLIISSALTPENLTFTATLAVAVWPYIHCRKARAFRLSILFDPRSIIPDTPTQVLLVDDDADRADLHRTFFQQRGVEMPVLHDANHLARRLERERPSIVVLDLMMPGIDGLTALKQLRASGDTIPVIMLTARADGVDREVGLELGADDYLGKPFMPQELLARIHAVLRRHAQPASAIAATSPEKRDALRFGRFRLDFASRTLFRDDEPVKLTGGEYALLAVLAARPMETLSRSTLLDLLHGPDSEATERGIDVPVWRLCRLLENDPSNPRRIQTVRGVGYMFVPGAVEEGD